MSKKVDKDVEYYMSLPYTIEVKRSGDGYFAKIPELPGCMTYASSWEELGEMIQDAVRGYIEVSLEYGDPIPQPVSEKA